MGGGDLNLKKSWHPSTLRNIERVWKAEQKHEAEIQKIEQLQKELADERAREEIQTFAEDQGVVRKKEEKLDWMYQGPAAMVNRDEFLLGRKIDKTFEKMQLVESGKAPQDETADVGSTLFSSQSLSGTATVDLATKIREDPLFNIMKKEKEQRKNLLTNPVKMKQLQQMLKASLTEKSKKKNKKSKKKKHQESSDSEVEKPQKRKKHKKHRSSSSDEEYKHINESKKNSRTKLHKEYHPDDEELVSGKKHSRSQSPHKNGDSNHIPYSSSKYSRNNHYEQDAYRERTSKSYAEQDAYRERTSNKSYAEQDVYHERKSKNYAEQDAYHERSSKSYAEQDNYRERTSKRNAEQDAYHERTSNSYAKYKPTDKVYERRDYSPKQQRRSSPKNNDDFNGYKRNRTEKVDERRDYSLKQQRRSPPKYNDDFNGHKRNISESSSPQRKPDKSEAERLLKEMQENAKWRERQRKKNTERYKEEDEKEDNIKRVDASDFMKPMLSKAAGKGSLENRVKQKIFSIQRSSAAMDKNFARRE